VTYFAVPSIHGTEEFSRKIRLSRCLAACVLLKLCHIEMAEQEALNAYLQDVLRIESPSIRAGLFEQGLTSFLDFETLTEKDIMQICANVRRPGGLIPNPMLPGRGRGRGAAAAVDLPPLPPQIPNPGTLVGHVVEVRLKMLCYFVKHLVRVQRMPFVAAEAPLDRLMTVYRLKEVEEEEKDDELKLPTALTKIDEVRVTLEDLDDYFRRKLGDSGAPLAYVTRDDPGLPVEDPGFGLPTFAEEMIARAPHTGAVYQRNNNAVWNVIRHVTHGGPAWNWVSAHQRSCDGRAAYLALKSHYLGETFTTRIRAIADGRINLAFFDGKARNFTFEKYCEVLNNAFTDLESSGETVDESRKIRMFMQGLNDPRLQSAKDTITANPTTLGALFDSAVTYVGTVMEQQSSLGKGSRTRDVSSASTSGRGGRGRGGRGGRGAGRGGGREHNRGGGRGGRGGGRHSNLTDRYYKPEEWEKLSYDERQTVRDKRMERDKRRNVQVVDRNVRSRQTDQTQSETSSTPASASAPAASNTSSGVTSRRNGPSAAFRDS
jgi:hypothetical protein